MTTLRHALAFSFSLFACVTASAQTLWPVPPEISSGTHFTVSINGQSTPVMHAAMNIDFLNFPAGKKLKITVTADNDDQWSKGVEVQPWRLGIRPVRSGRTLSFTLDGPAKITLTQPNDVLFSQPTLLLFANPVEKNPPTSATPTLRYIGPGAHAENIDANSGDNIYLAPGAVVFGALNIWQVHDVHVFGRGVIVYDGPQNPGNDDGWHHQKNWHCIVMDNASNITVEGVTCVVRSRTWQIQMKDSHQIVFDNLKVIGANSGNANADGMDWLGGGDTIVRNSFFRAADDVFGLQSSWEGYGPVAFAVQGKPVSNITIENSIFSTSISNIVRAAWPEKNYEGANVVVRNSDVTDMGMGGCGIPFALMEFWAAPHGRGKTSGFSFDNIRLEHWTSLTQLMQSPDGTPTDGLSDVHFSNISALELPSLVPNILKGTVSNTTFANVNLAGVNATKDVDLPLQAQDGAAEPSFSTPNPTFRIVAPTGLVKPGQKIALEAVSTPDASDMHYDWTFGDGTSAHGRRVKHKFSDADGTLLDGSGRFRVILHASGAGGLDAYVSSPVMVAGALAAATTSGASMPGLHYAYSETGTEITGSGTAATVSAAPIRKRAENYALTFDGSINIPADGGYTFTLVGNDTASIALDGKVYSIPKLFPQVCGLAGNSPQTVTLSAALAKGPHTLRIVATHTTGEDDLRLLWQAPNQPVTEVPPGALTQAP